MDLVHMGQKSTLPPPPTNVDYVFFTIPIQYMNAGLKIIKKNTGTLAFGGNKCGLSPSKCLFKTFLVLYLHCIAL